MSVLLFILRLIGYVWSFPLSLIGLVLLLPYGPLWVQWNEGFLEIGATRLIGYQNTVGQTHGWITFFKYRTPDLVPSQIRTHEHWHGWQGTVGGILYGVSYVLFFLALFVWYRDSNTAYMMIPWEVWARKRAGQS